MTIKERAMKKVVGEVLDLDVRRSLYRIEFDDERGRMKMTEEALMFDPDLSVDDDLTFVYEDVSEQLCTDCGGEPFYDSKANEYYCPLCDQ